MIQSNMQTTKPVARPDPDGGWYVFCRINGTIAFGGTIDTALRRYWAKLIKSQATK